MKTSFHFLSLLIALCAYAGQVFASSNGDIDTPRNSAEFGRSVTALPNGNFVVTDPSLDGDGMETSIGAVHLYDAEGNLLSTLMGSTTNDNVGSGGVQVLANGNFLVRSPDWDSSSGVDAGAVTWGSAISGFIGGAVVVVSEANSLVGTTADDRVGANAVATLNNGHYIVPSPQWDGAATNVGAVTWCNGITGTVGAVHVSNSLVGSTTDDMVGANDITVLTNGNYVVRSPTWDGAFPDVGAVTWCNGSNGNPFGESGPGAAVSVTNSLVGSTASDIVGGPGVTALTNGNYVVASSFWDNPIGPITNVGAVTWCDGGKGRAGAVTTTNSLIGGTAMDQVGADGVTALTNGNYVVGSSFWINPSGSVSNAGAATWCNGTNGVPAAESSPGAVVSAANSMVGTTQWDYVGTHSLVPLTNGNYVVCVPDWDNPITGTTDAGAATWGSGVSGVVGTISVANSLIGGSNGDYVGSQIAVALTNGNYVVRSYRWDNGAAMDAGAATWGSGTTGVRGVVSAANSLIGSSSGDNVSGGGVTVLENGNYVVSSPFWNVPGGGVQEAGAATWGSGTTGVKGNITAANSLIGGSTKDRVGQDGVVALTNSNYVVASGSWDNPTGPSGVGAATWGNGSSGVKGLVTTANSLTGSLANDRVGNSGVTALTNGNYLVSSRNCANTSLAASNAGAVTWGNGSTGIKGPVTAANSVVGGTTGDLVGDNDITALPNGNYVIYTATWDHALYGLTDSGAVTLGNGSAGTVGLIITANSVLGTRDSQGATLSFSYDGAHEQLFVGRPAENIVTRMGNLFRTLAKTGVNAPGALDITFGATGSAAVNEAGGVLADFTLTGPGSTGARNKGLFGTPDISGSLDLVMQLGDNLSGLGGGLPANAKGTAFAGHVTQQVGRGLFFATLSGTGIATGNNTALLRDNGASLSLLRRTGQLIPGLGMPATFREVVQNHDYDLLALSYQLKTSATAPIVSATSDTGLLPLTHGGSIINSNLSAHEGQPAFGGVGVFGEFTGRAVCAQETTIHFAAALKNGATTVAALFRMTPDGLTTARTAKVGDSAPGAAPAAFASFPALSQSHERALFKATLSGCPGPQNEGLWREGDGTFLVRKGVTEVLPGVKVASIIRFWPTGSDQVVFHATLSGTGVTGTNNEALVLLQNDGAFLMLLRKGDSPPGIGIAKILAISTVDVNPSDGAYTVLTTLTNSPSDSNQALWTGSTAFGNNSTSQFRRMPQLRLRKGEHYSTTSTALGLVKSIALKPAVDATGAGGRGLAQAISRWGSVVIYITGASGQIELVVLPDIILPA